MIGFALVTIGAEKGFRYVADKFSAAGRTPVASQLVGPPGSPSRLCKWRAG
jgi:hypothetical protein